MLYELEDFISINISIKSPPKITIAFAPNACSQVPVPLSSQPLRFQSETNMADIVEAETDSKRVEEESAHINNNIVDTSGDIGGKAVEQNEVAAVSNISDKHSLRSPIKGGKGKQQKRSRSKDRRSASKAENRIRTKRRKERKKHRSPSLSSDTSYSSSSACSSTTSENESNSDWEHNYTSDNERRRKSSSHSKKRKRRRSMDSPPPTKKLKTKSEKFHLLKVVPEKDKKKWSLPEELADFCNENANKFIPDKDMVLTITGDLPVPTRAVAELLNLGGPKLPKKYRPPWLADEEIFSL